VLSRSNVILKSLDLYPEEIWNTYKDHYYSLMPVYDKNLKIEDKPLELIDMGCIKEPDNSISFLDLSLSWGIIIKNVNY
jgi:hypothetical protein